MSFNFPSFFGAIGASNPPNLTATLVAVSQVLECRDLRSFFFEPAAEAFQRAILLLREQIKSLVKLTSPLALA